MQHSVETFNAKVTDIVHLMEAQAQLALVSGETAARQRATNNERLDLLLFEVERFATAAGLFHRMQGIISALRERRKQIPRGPQFMTIKEVQSLLNYPNLVILTVEETPTSGLEIPEIARFVAIDSKATLLFDHPLQFENTTFMSSRHPYGVVARSSLEDHTSMRAQRWQELLSVLSGHYALCENVLLLQAQLTDIAKRFNLEMPVIVGQSVFTLLLNYFGMLGQNALQDLEVPYEIDIAPLCERLGIPFSRLSHATAINRATMLLHLLQAMAQGMATK